MAPPYTSTHEYLHDYLDLLALRLQRQVLRVRLLRGPGTDDSFVGLFLSDEEMSHVLNELLGAIVPRPGGDASLESSVAALAAHVDARLAATGDRIRPARLAALFGLSPPALETVMLLLAPEVDRRFARVYAYLQDDVTRRWASPGLVLALLAGAAAADRSARGLFTPDSVLVREQLVRVGGEGEFRSVPLIDRPLKLDDRIVEYLLEHDPLDQALEGAVTIDTVGVELSALPLEPDLLAQLRRLVALWQRTAALPAVFCGPDGSGKMAAAAAVARELGRPLLTLDAQAFTSWGETPAGEAPAGLLRRAEREARLRDAILHIRHAGALPESARPALVRLLGSPMVVSARSELPHEGLDRPPVVLHFPVPGYEMRRALWLGALPGAAGQPTGPQAVPAGRRPGQGKNGHGPPPAAPDLGGAGPGDRRLSPIAAADAIDAGHNGHRLSPVAAGGPGSAVQSAKGATPDVVQRSDDGRLAADLAGRFRLTPGQIERAAQVARQSAWLRLGSGAEPTEADLYEACRGESTPSLTSLAAKVVSPHTWSDLVLPEPQIGLLHAIGSQVRHRHTVYEEWGFDRKLGLGMGLTALFSGPSGTGKTMAAGILARSLGLDMYRIDLSSVVSKYIGETEKNLSHIFDEAGQANVVLFFDEADALFGKRSEVKDAHDRYANIETSYLLQRMEEYQGVAILASNFSQNLDEAFTRRIHFLVEFPFPSSGDRERIWRGLFPPQAPQAGDIDYRFLAVQFDMAGGNIKNAVVAAAFLAAEEGLPIDMGHIVQAVARELAKMGRPLTRADFGEYYLLARKR